MSSERQGGIVVFHCDACPEHFESDTRDFREAWDEAKEEGWVAFKVGDEWCHHCPGCAG
jgi:hypothetical protein